MKMKEILNKYLDKITLEILSTLSSMNETVDYIN